MDAAHELKEEEERNKPYKIKVTIKIYTYLYTVSDVEVDKEDGIHVEEGSSTGLDPHTNIPLLGRHAYLLLDIGGVAYVSPFTPDYASIQRCIVIAVVKYD